AEELGGADVHSRQSGVTDHYAQNDAHAIGIARRIVATLKQPTKAALNMREPREPMFPAEEIYGVVSADGRKPFDVHDIIARIVDGSEFDEFKKLYGTTLIRSEEHTSELQSRGHLVCRLLLEKKNNNVMKLL